MAEGATIANAFVQIMPSAEGATSAVAKSLGLAGEQGGEEASKGFLARLKGLGKKLAPIAAAAGAAISVAGVAIAKAAVDAYADFEQLAGGVEVLYGDAAQAVMENANNAFRTAGVSANEYMEQSTSMAAALLNSLGGDAAEAARMADVAITDMADNANRMGSDLTSIQNAYAGFAKGNFQMLDNLKLGYGGNRSEMERLLADAEAISGIHYDIENYADVVDAIHVIQTEMGVTGATAEEAASTISGSWGMLSSSWENLLVSIAGGGEELDVAIRNVVDSLFTWLGNIVPRVGEVIKGMMQALPSIIEEALPQIGDAVMGFIRDTFGDGTANAVTEFADMVREKFGAMMERISGHLADFQAVMDEKVIPAFSTLKETMQPIIDAVVPAIIEVLAQFGSAVVGLAPIIADFVGGVAIVFNNLLVVAKNVWDGISGAIEGAVEFVTSLVNGDFEGMRDTVSGIFDGILSTAQTVWNGIKSAIETPINSARDIVRGAIDAIKGFFDFKFEWPHIPLPHFSITGSVNPIDWITGGLPQIGISWYGSGGLVDGATLIGAGERGTELVWPSYEPYLSQYAEAIARRIGGGGNVYVGATAINDDAMIRSNYEQLVLRSYRRAGRL